MGPPSTTSTSPKINKLFRRNSSSVASQAPPPSNTSSSDHPPSSFVNPEPSSSHHGFKRLLRKSSKILIPDKNPSLDDEFLVETPVIVEPPPLSGSGSQPQSPDASPEPQSQPIPRTIGRGGTRPLTMTFASNYDASSYAASPSTARFSDISSRFSGWFNQNFAGGSVTDLPSTLAPSTTVPPLSRSPTHKASALLNARKVGGPVVDKVVRYFLDSDSQPDKCPDPIWLMGVKHPGYEPSALPPAVSLQRSNTHRRESTEANQAQRSTPPTVSRGNVPTFHKNPSLQSLSLSASSPPQTVGWPPAFYEDFTSCIWMTYRSSIMPPLRDITLAELDKGVDISTSMSSPAGRKWWPVGREKEWSSDAGWGCMLRTGQGLLITALMRLHLGREWRRPNGPSFTTEYATYIKILSWFLDSPSPLCPFGVHRMALAGKELGTDVGCWFGPSIAAGAIKRLTNAYPDCGLSVHFASTSEVFESEVYAASHTNAPQSDSKVSVSKWGGRPVLVLVGIRLGIDAVTPVYYDGIKELFKWHQCVGISGGRPSSSYFFVGQQAGSLFYLDPHHTRPTVPLRSQHTPQLPIPPSPTTTTEANADTPRPADSPTPASPRNSESVTASSPRHSSLDRDFDSLSLSKSGRFRSGSIKLKARRPSSNAMSASPPRSVSATFSSPTHTHPSSSNVPQSSLGSNNHTSLAPSPLSQSQGLPSSSQSSFVSDYPTHIDPEMWHYANAYPPQEIRTFHCEKVRKMPLSAMDPSMLLGFLVKDEGDWLDLRFKVSEFAKTNKPPFTIQDEPPQWSDPDDLESFSDPDEPDEGENENEDNGDDVDVDNLGEDEQRVKHAKSFSTDSARTATTASDEFEVFGPPDMDPITAPTANEQEDAAYTVPLPPSDTPEPEKRASTQSDSTKGTTQSSSTRAESLNSFSDEDEDEDWDSSVPSSSPPVVTKQTTPPSSRPSTSSSPPTSPQYPFPTSEASPSPVLGPRKGRVGGMRALKGKDGGRTPSGGVLAIFNPQQEDDEEI